MKKPLLKHHALFTPYELQRLSAIRKSLDKFQAMGMDTSTWEAEFFLDIIARLVIRNVVS